MFFFLKIFRLNAFYPFCSLDLYLLISTVRAAK